MSVRGSIRLACRQDVGDELRPLRCPERGSILWMGDKVVNETRELPVADGHPLHVENERFLGVPGGYVHQLVRLFGDDEKLESLNLGVAIPTDACRVVVQEGLDRQVIGGERDQR